MLCWVDGGIKLSLTIFKNGLAKKNGQQTSIFDFFFFLVLFVAFVRLSIQFRVRHL